MTGYRWVSSSSNQGVPPDAVLAGHDSNGDAIYAGRAVHAGDMIPAKIIPNKRKGYVSYDGKEHEKDEYEILCGAYCSWERTSGGSVPGNAMACGRTSNGEILYIGRGDWQGSMTPGKVHPSHGCLYIPYDGKEISLKEYEVLFFPS